MKTKLISIVLAVIFIITLTSCSTPDSSQPTSNITSLNISIIDKNITIEAGEEETGYISVQASGEYADSEIKLISSNSNIATFEFDTEKSAPNCIYYKIKGISKGSTTVYAETTDGTIKTDALNITVTGYTYDIVSIDDIGSPITRESRLRVTVPKQIISSMSDAEITDLLKFIANEYSNAHRMNAVVVFLYADGDDTTGDFTIASCTYAPYADIDKAEEVKAGDYETFDYAITINSPTGQ